MKVCYADESGKKGTDRCMTMVGLMVDAQRLNRTRTEFGQLFCSVEEMMGHPVRELKGSKILNGRDEWRHVGHQQRKDFIRTLCRWTNERDATILLSSIDFVKYDTSTKPVQPWRLDPWLSCGMHIALQVQKLNQGMPHNKGHTFLFFDQRNIEELSDLLFDPPSWTDDFYKKKARHERLDQVIDPACDVKSHHAGLVQVADLLAFLFRRYEELHGYGATEEYDGERALIDEFVAMLLPRVPRRSARWPTRGAGASAQWFVSVASPALFELRP